jgi:ribosomal protein L12E/L44/L45/RPP1/RPP2
MTGPSEGNAMTEQALTRLAELQREYEVGQRRLQELVAQEVSIRETLLRINGAIQVLTELTGQSAPSADAAAAAAEQEAEAPAPGAVLRVG